MDLQPAYCSFNRGQVKEMMNDPRYYNPNQRDPGFVKMVDEGFKKMYNK